MKWYDCKKKLPPINTMVLVLRQIRLDFLDHPVLVHDIGVLKGTDSDSRWELESQNYAPLPIKPTVDSGIITHWARLPKFPINKEEEK